MAFAWACPPELSSSEPTPGFAKATAGSLRAITSEGWAHQDSNLERAGYEPAALTVELWARRNYELRIGN